MSGALAGHAFERLLDAAPDGIVVVDGDGRIVFVNAQIESLLGYRADELIGEPVDLLVPEGVRAGHVAHRRRYRATPRTRPMGSALGLFARRKDGSELPVEISLSPLPTEAGVLVTAIVRDVTIQRAAAGALRDSEERYRLLAQNALDIIYRVVLTPLPPRVEYVSPSIRLTGHSPDEFYARPALFLEVVHPADREIVRRALEAPDEVRGPLTVRFRARDGTITWQEHRLVVVRGDDGAPIEIEGIARDITDRVNAEEERRILLADSEMQRERERIAADLHDGVMQSIYGVGLSLRRATSQVAAEHSEVKERLDEAVDELSGVIADIRRYVMDLRPVQFSGDLGRSLADVARLFEASSGIATTLEIDARLPVIDEDRGLALFHIAREALSNVRRHARATGATLSLRVNRRDLTLVVRDDGVGFDPGTLREGHFGLGNMALRARAAGGQLKIASQLGAGTTVEVQIPVRPQ